MAQDEDRIAYFRAIAQTMRDYNEALAVGQTLAAIAADLTEKINQWRHHARTCTFEFRALASDDDIYFATSRLSTNGGSW